MTSQPGGNYTGVPGDHQMPRITTWTHILRGPASLGWVPTLEVLQSLVRDRKSTEVTPGTLYLRSQNELVDQSYPTLCDPMDCSTPGFPVHHQLLELAQTHVHWVGDVIQPSHPLSSPSAPAFRYFPVSQFFVLGGQSIGASASASVLPMNIQDWFPLRLTGLVS